MPEVPEEELKVLREKAAQADSKTQAAADYQKDMLKFKDESAARQLELDKIKGQQTEAEKKTLLEKEQFKELWEKAEKEKAEALKKGDEAILTVDRYIKQGALETAALQAGIRKEALPDLKLLGFDKLTVVKEGTEVKVKGIEDFIADQKKTRPHWFGESPPPGFNGAGGGAGGGNQDGKPSAADLTKMQKEDPAKYREAMKQLMADKAAKK